MSWTAYRWTWQLKSPLYVGYPPAGSLNRTRLYIPARTIWGALTAFLARQRAGSDRFPSYSAVGEELRGGVRFSYLYPAEPVAGQWRAWVPVYEHGKGLVWVREDRRSCDDWLANRAFRMRLLGARPSTAIEPSTDAAEEGSLRETECINTHWRSTDGGTPAPVAMVGYVFVEDDATLDVEEGAELFVGGDTRYGLGRLYCVEKSEVTDHKFFDADIADSAASPRVQSTRVLGHAVDSPKVALRGDREVVVGWNSAKGRMHCERIEPLWVPGSSTQDGTGPVLWRIDEHGIWIAEP